jgi:predicted AlkP superfamily phosphohydrolase/phosphomutase
MKRRRFMKITGAAAGLAAAGGAGTLLTSCGRGPAERRPAARRVIVLGVGGLDAATLERLMAEGKLPHLAAMARRGTFAPLRTTTPAEGGVAWAAFASGKSPGANGIFGHYGRDAESYRPIVADVDYELARYLGSHLLLRPRYRPYLAGDPFWRRAAAAGITTAAMWAPADFSPEEVEGGLFLAGGNVPDADLGSYRYHFFASDVSLPEGDKAGGGTWRRIETSEGRGRVAFEAPSWLGAKPFEVEFEPRGAIDLLITVAGQTQAVSKSAFSNYFTLPVGGGLSGRGRLLARFFVALVAPEIRVWLLPLEIDPRAPLFDVAAPDSFGDNLAFEEPFSTRGRPLDIGALHDGAARPGSLAGQFAAQTEEKRRLGRLVWREHAPDLFLQFDYGLGEISRIFWRFFDPGHPAYSEERFYSYGDAFEGAYRYMDDTVGKYLSEPGAKDAAFFVVSAHGCRPFRRSFGLNRWLLENAYLKLPPGARPMGVNTPVPDAALRRGKYRPAVAWDETRAHAQGYGQIYLNVRGRDGRGVVAPGDVAALKAEITKKLFAVRDGGLKPVVAVADGGSLFDGPRGYCAPDLVVSLADGYRVSAESVLGGLAPRTFADNLGVVSGDHASVEAGAVPGLVLSNLKLESEGAGVEDIGPTVLNVLGLDTPAGLDGRPLVWTPGKD